MKTDFVRTNGKLAGGASQSDRLRKELGLMDVYAVSTGAMFSSGFFLLPGLAAAQTGPSVALAYLVAALFILPALFAVAELATAMPRAGGAYYFLDRSLGPMVGTVGGLGTWVALVFKSAFALVGIGAYLAIYVDVPVKPVAVAMTLAFVVVNIVGAKETTGLQRILVGVLLAVLGLFIIQGIAYLIGTGLGATLQDRFRPFFTSGATGFFSTVGFVFVSYAGLTKVASVSEEIRDPERNIPLGMMLSLGTATFVYVVGVFILVAVVPPLILRADLAPVATAAETLFAWVPGGIGVFLVVVAALAAFASTGNAGILSASRYPLAMARDGIVPPRLAELGRFRTPTLAILVTGGMMVAAILLLDIEAIAKLASAFQLLLFSLLSFAVVIMRESEIEGYDPGYRSPLYPFMQIFGFLAPLWLIVEMGQLAILFTFGLTALTVGWYFGYARDRVERTGAIFHTFARLGAHRHNGLDLELREIVREKGLRDEDPYDQAVARAPVLDYPAAATFDAVARDLAPRLAAAASLSEAASASGIEEARAAGVVSLRGDMALLHWRDPSIGRPVVALVRSREGIEGATDPEGGDAPRGLVVLVSRKDEAAQHLRLLGHLATRMAEEDFPIRWREAGDPDALRATLMREERTLTVHVGHGPDQVPWVGRDVQGLNLPAGTLVALVRRGREAIVPGGSTVLEESDRLTVLGTTAGIAEITRDLEPSPNQGVPPVAGREVEAD